MNIFEECLKCQNDFVYFAGKYLKIFHPKKGVVDFTLYDFQKKLIETYNKERFVVLKKFRQGGFSTVTVMYGLWRCLFHHKQSILFISKTDREAKGLSGFAKRAIELLPEHLKPNLKIDNDHEKSFAMTESKMIFRSATAGRSMAATHVIIDEAAFIPNMDRHWLSIYPILSAGGKCFVLSTVNGIGNWFYDLYQNSSNENNSFKVFETDFKEHPDYNNEEWVKRTRENLGEKGYLQEVEACFIGSGNLEKFAKKQKLIKMICDIFEEDEELVL